jgi:hypothetical protein
MYGIGNDPLGGQQDGDRLMDRILADEYNQDVQRGDTRQAVGTLARLFGLWLSDRLAR